MFLIFIMILSVVVCLIVATPCLTLAGSGTATTDMSASAHGPGAAGPPVAGGPTGWPEAGRLGSVSSGRVSTVLADGLGLAGDGDWLRGAPTLAAPDGSEPEHE